MEVLIGFSTAIIQNRLKVNHVHQSSVVHQLCISRRLPSQSIITMSCLVLAHKISLKSFLCQKAVMKKRFQDFCEVLRQKDDELNNKFEKVIEKQEFLAQNVASESVVTRVASALDRNWTGDRRLITCIVEGEQEVSNDSLLDKQFSDVWSSVRANTLSDELGKERKGLLRDLELRVSAQTVRLQRWRAFREGLRATKTSANVQIDRTPTNRAHAFPRTKYTQDDRQAEREMVFSPKKSPRKSTLRESNNVDHTRDFLTSPASLDSRSSFSQVYTGTDESLQSPTRCPSVSSLKVSSGASEEPFPDRFSPHKQWAEMGEGEESLERMSENSWQLDAPNTVVQLGIMNTQSNGSSGKTNCEKDQTPDQAWSGALQDLDTGLHAREARTGDAESPIASTRHVVQHNPLLTNQNTSDGLSLEQRTRKTMAMASMGSQPQTIVEQECPAATPISKMEQSPERAIEVTANHTLLERTRQSMSRVPAVPRTSHKQPKHQRLSRCYPTNQFETPRKNLLHHDSAITEDLFDSDLDHDSVFKSRPKVALSPSASPQPRMTFDENEPIRADCLDDSPLTKLSIRT